MLAALKWMDRAISAVLSPVVVAGMAALAAVITLQIVSRMFFTSVSWTEEVARFLLIWITFLGATLAFQQGRHIAVRMLRDSLPPTLRRIVSGAGILIAIAFLATLTWIGWTYMTLQSFQRSSALRIPMNNIYFVMPLAGALMASLSVIDLIHLCAGEPARDDRTESAE
ncbi:TRAP transporter small permease [Shimia sp. FJ5]|uniref:TRAP transporter small permease n=1 Tax=Shimia sp. FJ5 TaxID=3079054 RepID=UPI00293DEFDD|nr:TRAP transporter small permease [Shimia sp. FJ5]MDV4146662.1 TRAP transporter small permease [Shimia sp. FJ5]